MNIRTLSLSLFLLFGISKSAQAMQNIVPGGCTPTIAAVIYSLAVANPVPTVVIGGAAYAGYKGYNYFTAPKPTAKK